MRKYISFEICFKYLQWFSPSVHESTQSRLQNTVCVVAFIKYHYTWHDIIPQCAIFSRKGSIMLTSLLYTSFSLFHFFFPVLISTWHIASSKTRTHSNIDVRFTAEKFIELHHRIFIIVFICNIRLWVHKSSSQSQCWQTVNCAGKFLTSV